MRISKTEHLKNGFSSSQKTVAHAAPIVTPSPNSGLFKTRDMGHGDGGMSQRTNHQDAFGHRKPLSGGVAGAVLAEKRGREAHSFARGIFSRARGFSGTTVSSFYRTKKPGRRLHNWQMTLPKPRPHSPAGSITSGSIIDFPGSFLYDSIKSNGNPHNPI